MDIVIDNSLTCAPDEEVTCIEITEQNQNTAVNIENAVNDKIEIAEDLSVEITNAPKEEIVINATNDKPASNNKASSDLEATVNGLLVDNGSDSIEKYMIEIKKLKTALQQKDNMLNLIQREKLILEKEKGALRLGMETAIKEKESVVIKYAMQEKLLIDAKKESDVLSEKLKVVQVDLKNKSSRVVTLTEEKDKITGLYNEKCMELRKSQRDCEKLRSEVYCLETKVKNCLQKLNVEIESKNSLGKQLEELKSPKKLQAQEIEQQKIENDANAILIKHELETLKHRRDEVLKDLHKLEKKNNELQENLEKSSAECKELTTKSEHLAQEKICLENALREEREKITKLETENKELLKENAEMFLLKKKTEHLKKVVQKVSDTIADCRSDIYMLKLRESELLATLKHMSETIARQKNNIHLLQSERTGIVSEADVLKMLNKSFEENINSLNKMIEMEREKKNEELSTLVKLLSDKMKLYELTKINRENLMCVFQAYKNKQCAIVKEFKRRTKKYKNELEHLKNNGFCNKENSDPSYNVTKSQQLTTDINDASMKSLIERILRLQQVVARQTEKIEFLENHTLSLVSELQKKTKVIQYYMMRDQTETSSANLFHQSNFEFKKYKMKVLNEVQQSPKSDLDRNVKLAVSLNFSKQVQSALEDTLIKNMTLKDNLEILGNEVIDLRKKLSQQSTE